MNNEKLSNDQIITHLCFKLLTSQDVWNMYKVGEISLEDYCYCLTEWKKEEEAKK